MMSWFSMIFKKNKNNSARDFNPSNRWIHYSNGAILDKEDESQMVWIVDSDWFEKWFFGIEKFHFQTNQNQLSKPSDFHLLYLKITPLIMKSNVSLNYFLFFLNYHRKQDIIIT